MNRFARNLAAFALFAGLAFLASGCRTERPPALPNESATESFDVATGKLIAKSNLGKSGGAVGQVADYTDAQILDALFRTPAPSNGRSFVRTVYSNLTQPDVQRIDDLNEKRKVALEKAEKAFVAGASQDYEDLLKQAAQLGVEIAGIIKAKGNRPQPDSASIIATVYSEGEGHTDVAKSALATGGAAVAARYENRAEYSDTKKVVTEDTTTAEELKTVATVALEMARLRYEIEKLKADQAKPSPAPDTTATTPGNGTPGATSPTLGGDAGLGLSDEQAREIISKLQFLDGTDRNHPQVLRLVKMYGSRITHFGGGNESNRAPDENNLWKPDSDNDGNLVVITASSKYAGAVTVEGDSATNLSIGNGWRPHFRFGKPGTGYGSSPRVVVGGVGSATIGNPGTKQTFKLTPLAKPADPVDPPPSTGALYQRTGKSLTLAPALAAVVSRVDALANIVEPGNPNPIIIPAVQDGDTWTLPENLATYPVGNRPNTWRLRLTGTPPPGVTWHTSISQTFIREGDPEGSFYPPTTRP